MVSNRTVHRQPETFVFHVYEKSALAFEEDSHMALFRRNQFWSSQTFLMPELVPLGDNRGLIRAAEVTLQEKDLNEVVYMIKMICCNFLL